MKLEILIDGRARTLELPEAGAAGVFRLDGQPLAADAREVEPGVYSILIGGRSYEVKIEAGAEGLYAGVNGRRYAIEVRDPRRLSRRRDAPGAIGRQRVTSPMPGKVVRLLVEPGAAVEAGQGLLVVEAMKMQNEIRSPKAGRVTAVLAVEGQTVAGGQPLAEVE